uniref:Uncharacterized protein n=3 Tax=Nothobranchius TaxID=28779 RepID=A0A1A7ZZX2_NOTFU
MTARQGDYQSMANASGEEKVVLGRKFFPIVAGKTNGAHQKLINDLRSLDQVEVYSAADADYLMIFCPIASRVETDISQALSDVPANKDIILVAMHHIFNPDHVIPESKKHVHNPNVILAVDCLFHDGKLLLARRNDNSWYDITKVLGMPHSQISWFKKFLGRKFFVFVAGNPNGAHQEIIDHLHHLGQVEVDSISVSDYLVVLCPIASRVETDINVALSSIPVGKPIILVVMHHTYDPHRNIADSWRYVQNPNVILTVDYLFHDGKLLHCDRNQTSLCEIRTTLGVSSPESLGSCTEYVKKKWWIVVIAVLVLIAVVIIASVSTHFSKR